MITAAQAASNLNVTGEFTCIDDHQVQYRFASESLPPLFTTAKSFNNSGRIGQSGEPWVSWEPPGVTQGSPEAALPCVLQAAFPGGISGVSII
ncbi:hypothetical protein llap_7339 [Limosa lapponica baueri]|uniref:Uncharacterized protein n=1 Tax=Limosa lapponica baueri TaxID=1758121 RepID=A0A2I0U8I9_LIMLA|nr:hypothetical protein llap_7339 [Limosa lapponica baueri]